MKYNFFSIAIRGLTMGIAEVIPGVSGGTIAFITGIYQTILDSIAAIDHTLIKELFKPQGYKKVWNRINGNFLIQLLIGMLIGFGIGIFAVTALLEKYPILLWAFFFGLILASCVYLTQQVTKFTMLNMALGILAAFFSYYLTIAVPTEGSLSLVYVFLSGAIAVSALILPGISGSFILLLLGMYTLIITVVKDTISSPNLDGIIIMATFISGMILGLLSIAKVLKWTFFKYPNQTLLVLTGFMFGSLNKIWPWRKATLVLDETGEIVAPTSVTSIKKILKEVNLSPSSFAEQVGDSEFVAAVISFALGLAMIYFLGLSNKKKRHQSN